MRIWQSLSLLAAAAAAAPLAAAQQAQVFLHPPPPSINRESHTPTLSKAQAEAVLAHHLGQDVSGKEAPENEGIWAHLLHQWGHKDTPRVIIVQGSDANDVMPDTIGRPAFYLDADADSVLEPYLKDAEEALERILNLPIVKNLLDSLDLAVSDAGKILARQLASLVALADRLWNGATEAWEAVSIDLGLAESGSDMWETARKGVQAGISSMTQPDSPPAVLVVMPPKSHVLVNHNYERQLEYGAEFGADLAKGGKKKPTKPPVHKNGTDTNGTVVDYTAPIVLLGGTSLLLVIVAVGSVALLAGVGETKLPSTLTLSIGGGHRRD